MNDDKNKIKLLLLGAGGHALSSIDVIESCKKYQILGLIDSLTDKKFSSNYKVLGQDDHIKSIIKEHDNIFAVVTIGQIKSPLTRKKLFNLIDELNIVSLPIISPFAYVSPRAKIGEGTMVFHRATVNNSATIGKNCIINSSSLIEHGAQISSHCHISTGAIINGDVNIEEGCFIGSGSIIKEGITIGKNSIISMGQNIFEDIRPNSIVKN